MSAQHMPESWEYDTDVRGTFMVFDPADDSPASVVARGIKTEADARLISAACDLLKELQGALQALDAHGFTQQAETARAVIAKATGAAS